MAQRRAWCSCTIIEWLKGTPKAADCDAILALAAAGRFEILVSTVAYGETVRIEGLEDDDAEQRIQEFFDRPYVVRVAVDLVIIERARKLIRQFRLSGIDAIHVATALEKGATVFETFDDKLMEKVTKGGGIDGLALRPATDDSPPVTPNPQQSFLTDLETPVSDESASAF